MKTSRYKVKIICGFRKEQEYTIDANEAHKAYYLFNNPDKRGTFDNGLAIKGSDINRITPDFNATMGWNHTHILCDDDWVQINAEGVGQKMNMILSTAKEVARIGDPADIVIPLSILMKEKYLGLADRGGSEFAQKLLGRK
jgi:hypothetical protein